jgi:hypothetical protein
LDSTDGNAGTVTITVATSITVTVTGVLGGKVHGLFFSVLLSLLLVLLLLLLECCEGYRMMAFIERTPTGLVDQWLLHTRSSAADPTTCINMMR